MPRGRVPARSREGAALMIVLLMVMMATGTAIFAMQATFYEQAASTSYAEAAWTRSLAEGATMATTVAVEEGGIFRGPGQDLSPQWLENGGVPADFSIRYAVPTPLQGTATPAANPDSARSVDTGTDSGAFASTPLGLTSFCAPVKNTRPAPYDGLPLPHARTNACHALYETWGGVGSGTSSTSAGVSAPVRPRTRSVITGFGQTSVPGDLPDTGGQRLRHDTVGMSRGYFDLN